MLLFLIMLHLTNGDHFLIETEGQAGDDYTGFEADNTPGCDPITTNEGVEVACINGLHKCDYNILSKPPHQRVELHEASTACKNRK